MPTLIADWPGATQTHPGLCGVERLAVFYPANANAMSQDKGFARRQEGSMGWITDEIVGPYKGEPGRSGW